VNVRPAIVNVPVRGIELAFAATVKVIVAGPVPPGWLVSVIHGSLLAAVHVQPVGDANDVDPGPPAAAIGMLVGVSENVHGSPAWPTENVWLPTVMVPLRGVAVGLAVTLKFTVPLPLPLPDGGVMVSHGELLLVAVHEQPVAVPTANDPL
jgi:hypothetical protein